LVCPSVRLCCPTSQSWCTNGRFTERKKANRLHKQLEERLKGASDPKAIDEIKRDIHICDVDRHYTIYFPYMERYVSLYPVSGLGLKVQGGPPLDEASSAARNLHSERPPLWTVVEKAMEKGQEALERLRDRRLGVDSRSKPPPQHSKHSFSAKAKELSTKRDMIMSSTGAPAANTPGAKADKAQRREQDEVGVHEESSGSEDDSSDDSSGDNGGFFEAE